MNIQRVKRLLLLSGIVSFLGALSVTLLVVFWLITAIVDNQLTTYLSGMVIFAGLCVGVVWVVVSLCFGLLTALKMLEDLLAESQGEALAAPEKE
jgi:hypothetical protein